MDWNLDIELDRWGEVEKPSSQLAGHLPRVWNEMTGFGDIDDDDEFEDFDDDFDDDFDEDFDDDFEEELDEEFEIDDDEFEDVETDEEVDDEELREKVEP